MSVSRRLTGYIIPVLMTVLLLSLPALSFSAEESFSGGLDPSVEHVLSGGLWEDGDSYGRYRVVVQNLGWEHTRSYLYLQWLETREDTETITELMSIPIPEFGEGGWHNVRKIDRDGNVFIIYYSERGEDGILKAVLSPGKPGKYSINLGTVR